MAAYSQRDPRRGSVQAAWWRGVVGRHGRQAPQRTASVVAGAGSLELISSTMSTDNKLEMGRL